MEKLRISETGLKLKLTESATQRVDLAKVAAGLGATHYTPLPELSKEEAEQYKPLGSTVIMSEVNEHTLLYFGSRMLEKQGKSIDDVVGYRVLGMDEEQEFRQQLANERNDPRYLRMPVVRYYGYGKKE